MFLKMLSMKKRSCWIWQIVAPTFKCLKKALRKLGKAKVGGPSSRSAWVMGVQAADMRFCFKTKANKEKQKMRSRKENLCNVVLAYNYH